MVFVLLTYGGWNEGAYISAEVKGGPRAIVRTLVLAIVVITVVYLAFVLAVLNGLGFAGMQKSKPSVRMSCKQRSDRPVHN